MAKWGELDEAVVKKMFDDYQAEIDKLKPLLGLVKDTKRLLDLIIADVEGPRGQETKGEISDDSYDFVVGLSNRIDEKLKQLEGE